MYGAPIADVHVHVHVHVLRKMFFRLVTSVGQKKILSPHEESNLRPSDLCSDALHYAINIADPSSMQDACHQNFVIDPAHQRVFVAQWKSIGVQIQRTGLSE